MWSKLKQLFRRNQVDPAFWDELEETLLTADVGPDLVSKWLPVLQKEKTVPEVMAHLQAQLRETLAPLESTWVPTQSPHVILMIGINGVGKTTTIAKLAHHLKSQNKSVILAAADTFRAAAVDQLKTWGERLGVTVVAQGMDADPAAVAFDGVQAGVARSADVVIIDTAGRLHTKDNLMEELRKIHRVVGKALPGAPHDVWCVLDATVGQNGIAQVRQFKEVVPLTGLVIAKWDGEAKAGVVCTLAKECPVPVRFVGTGESVGALELFSIEKFISRLHPV